MTVSGTSWFFFSRLGMTPPPPCRRFSRLLNESSNDRNAGPSQWQSWIFSKKKQSKGLPTTSSQPEESLKPRDDAQNPLDDSREQPGLPPSFALSRIADKPTSSSFCSGKNITKVSLLSKTNKGQGRRSLERQDERSDKASETHQTTEPPNGQSNHNLPRPTPKLLPSNHTLQTPHLTPLFQFPKPSNTLDHLHKRPSKPPQTPSPIPSTKPPSLSPSPFRSSPSRFPP